MLNKIRIQINVVNWLHLDSKAVQVTLQAQHYQFILRYIHTKFAFYVTEMDRFIVTD